MTDITDNFISHSEFLHLDPLHEKLKQDLDVLVQKYIVELKSTIKELKDISDSWDKLVKSIIDELN
jgi:hypothetical protein